MPSITGRSLGDQRVGQDFQSPLQVGTISSTNTFTARNTATLFSDTASVKQPVEQLQQSAFHRPLTGQENNVFNQQKSSSQSLLIPQTPHFQTPQKSMQNGSINGYKQQSSNVIIHRPSTMSDSYSCMLIIQNELFLSFFYHSWNIK